MKTVEQIRNELEQNGKYVFESKEESDLYENYLKGIDFISRAKKVGLPVIIHNGIEKVEINLQKPVILTDDFLFPIEFNHLVYFTEEKKKWEKIKSLNEWKISFAKWE